MSGEVEPAPLGALFLREVVETEVDASQPELTPPIDPWRHLRPYIRAVGLFLAKHSSSMRSGGRFEAFSLW